MGRKRKEDWPKRGRNEHLTRDEIATLRLRFRDRAPVFDVAREMRCSTRVIQKYFSQFAGRSSDRPRPRPSRAGLDRKPRLVEPPKQLPSRFYKSNFEL